MLAPPNEEELGGTVADKRIMEGDHQNLQGLAGVLIKVEMEAVKASDSVK